METNKPTWEILFYPTSWNIIFSREPELCVGYVERRKNGTWYWRIGYKGDVVFGWEPTRDYATKAVEETYAKLLRLS